MLTARVAAPVPTNEQVRTYAPRSLERARLKSRLEELAKETIEAPCIVAHRPVHTGATFDLRAPHDHGLRLAAVHAAGPGDVRDAIEAALYAKTDWAALPWDERASTLLKAAELIAGPWRDTMNAATMLGQSKTAHQAGRHPRRRPRAGRARKGSLVRRMRLPRVGGQAPTLRPCRGSGSRWGARMSP